MEKAHFSPIWKKTIELIYGKKIIGQASKEEIAKIYNTIAKIISEHDKKRTEDEIFAQLIKGAKIVYTKCLPVFSGAAGIASGNTIYIDKTDIDELEKNNYQPSTKSVALNTLVHESIHKLQKSKLSYKGNSTRGFVEGATDLMALRMTRRAKSISLGKGNISFNFPESNYIKLVSLMAQFENIFGEEIVSDYAFYQNPALLDKVQDLFGKDMFKSLCKDTSEWGNVANKLFKRKKSQYSFKFWQDILLKKAYDKKLEEIENQADAEKYLDNLKQLELVRAKIKGDTFYQDYYSSKLAYLKSLYPDLDIEKYTYKECKFNPEIYHDEKLSLLDDFTFSFISNSVENLDGFNGLNLHDYKRYRLENGENIFEVLTHKGKFCCLKAMDKTGSTRNSGLSVIANPDGTKSQFQVSIDSGNVTISIDDSYYKGIEHMQMTEIPLGFGKKEIYESMLEREASDIYYETFFEKIKRLLSRQKRLPAYTEIQEKITDNVDSSPKTWELSPEQQESFHVGELEVLNRNDYKNQSASEQTQSTTNTISHVGSSERS